VFVYKTHNGANVVQLLYNTTDSVSTHEQAKLHPVLVKQKFKAGGFGGSILVVVVVVLVVDVVEVVVDVVVVGVIGSLNKSIDISNTQHTLSGNSISKNCSINSHKGCPFSISEHK
jgi:hypothetical protein